jgi:predicted dehydrogenase
MTVTIGIIGAGAISASHIGGIRRCPELRISGVCDQSVERASAVAKDLDCAAFTDYRELLAGGPDAVAICLPHALHCPVALDAFKAGSHVLVEKPMATTVGDLNAMLDTAEQYGKLLIVTDSASFLPGPLVTGKKFRRGILGQFLSGSIINERFYFTEGRPAWFLDPVQSGGGMLSNVGVHRFAVARACLPGLTPQSVSAVVSHVRDHDIEACSSVLVRYREDGGMLYEEVGYFPKPAWLNVGTHLNFEHGIVSWDEGTWRMMHRDGTDYQEPLPTVDPPYVQIYRGFLRAVEGEVYSPAAWELATDVAIAQAAYASSRERRQIDLSEPTWRIRRPRR